LAVVVGRRRVLYNTALEQRSRGWERRQGKSATHYQQKMAIGPAHVLVMASGA
jgi:hypothetical protein